MTPSLAFRNLSVSFGRRAALRDASAAFASGGLVALVGPNGAGKTTLVRAIAGLVPSTGDLEILGRPAADMGARERARAIGYLPQGHSFHWPLAARDIVALGRYAHGTRDPARLSSADIAAVAAALDMTDATAFADRPVTELSGGETARIALARVLAAETPILLIDEPIATLDPRHQLLVMDLLKSLAAADRLVIAVLHDLSLAWRYADRVLVMADGRIAADDAAAAALSPDMLREVFGVRAVVASHDGRAMLWPVAPT